MSNHRMLKHTELQALLADYRDLRGAERAAVDEHLRTCASCAARLADYQAMDRDLTGLHDARPDARLRTGYYETAQPQPGKVVVPARRPRRLPLLSGIAAAVLMLAVAVWVVLRPGEPQPLRGMQPIPTDPGNALPPTLTVGSNQAPEPTISLPPAPTAAPVTITGEATRDPETTQVMLDIYSGRPNPVWTLTADESQALRELLDMLPEAACEPLELNLGYRGFVLELGQPPELSNEYRLRVYGKQVRWGDPWTPGAPALCHSDAEAVIARFLLASGRPHLPAEAHALIEQEIQAAGAVPGDWLSYTDAAFGFSLAHPPGWSQPESTEQSRLFYVNQAEPTGPTFPALYVTVIPEGFTNESAEAYNFWNAAEVAAALALPEGAAAEIHGAREYNAYTRLPDVTVDRETGVVVENSRVWEGGPDTRDRRVLVVHGATTYLLGTYYSTPEELEVFERVIASFSFTPSAGVTQEPAVE